MKTKIKGKNVMENNLFILAQILAIIAFALTTLSLQFKKKSSILGMQIASNVAYMFEYICLGAFSGGITFIIGTIRNITYYILEKKKCKPKLIVLLIFIILIVIAGIITYENLISILPIVAVVIWTIVSWQEDPKWMRIGETVICIMWIVYDLIVKAYTGMITESIILTSCIIGIIRNDIRNKKLNKVDGIDNKS